MKLLLIALIFLGLNVSAEETVNKPVVCGILQEVQVQMKSFGKTIIWTAPSSVEESEYVFYGNRETGTWTLVQIIKGIGCLMAFGEAGKHVRAGT